MQALQNSMLFDPHSELSALEKDACSVDKSGTEWASLYCPHNVA